MTYRVFKAEYGSVQSLPLKGLYGVRVGCPIAATIERVTDERMAHVGHMHPYLMGTSGLQATFDQRCAHAEPFQQSIMRYCPLSGGGNGHFLPVSLTPTDWTFNPVRYLGRYSPQDRMIAPFDSVGGELHNQPLMGIIAFGDDHKAAGILVYPVHDSGPPYPAYT